MDVQAEGGVLLKGAAHGAKTHHRGEFSTLKAEWIVTKQQGRVLHGIFKSPRATEKFVAVIAEDNKSFTKPMKMVFWKVRSAATTRST